MPSRHRSRQRALQILFQIDLSAQPLEQALAGYFGSLCSDEPGEPAEPDPFLEALLHGVLARRDEIDALIRRHSEHWRLERMRVVDRNLLRLAVFELTATDTPPAVVIDEALELARRFSEPDAVPFLNGVLDAIRRDLSGPETPHDPGPQPQ
jgi:N utilization substance protein B